MAKFCQYYHDLNLHPTDINLEEFVNYCNYGKERMILIQGGTKLFYTTTIEFQESSTEVTTLTNNWNHVGIIKKLSEYEETKAWLVKRINEGKILLKEKLPAFIVYKKDKDGNYQYPEPTRKFCKLLLKDCKKEETPSYNIRS